ncbi:hypothetical protein MLD38_004633 [Melastoma candidum]|uniref:Uncharacterized protein n=1 Tax=Melastoma candidum TaxID=119954 RepID=A0ACB9S6A5_9MYRT|nr:hypothetical protein MLD38_004633 [Melastoma candidum]
MNPKDCQRIYLEVKEFYKSLDMEIEERIPINLVNKFEMEKKLSKRSRCESQLFPALRGETRGLCEPLLQPSICTMIERPIKIGDDDKSIEIRKELYTLVRNVKIKGIFLLYGFPRMLTKSILVHEMMHVWLAFGGLSSSSLGYIDLHPEVREGICQVMAHMWLSSEIKSLPSRRGAEIRLGEFFKYNIENSKMEHYALRFNTLLEVRHLLFDLGLFLGWLRRIFGIPGCECLFHSTADHRHTTLSSDESNASEEERESPEYEVSEELNDKEEHYQIVKCRSLRVQQSSHQGSFGHGYELRPSSSCGMNVRCCYQGEIWNNEQCQARDARYATLNDGRVICSECLGTAVLDPEDFSRIYLEVKEFYKSLDMDIEEQISIKLVDKFEMEKETKKAEKPMIERPATIGDDDKIVEMRKEPYYLVRNVKIRGVLVLYGYPRILTQRILVHEMMHVWLKFGGSSSSSLGYLDLQGEVEEGICEVMAHMWLSSEIKSLPSRRQSEIRLGEYLKYRMEKKKSDDYGRGFQKGNAAVMNCGLKWTLDYIRMTKTFPP